MATSLSLEAAALLSALGVPTNWSRRSSSPRFYSNRKGSLVALMMGGIVGAR